MNQIRVVIFLCFFTIFSLDFVEPKRRPPTKRVCKFPHKGDGGVLDENQMYIKDSVLVWVDIANNSYQWVSDLRGNVELDSWIDASEKFNDAMQKGDEDESFKRLHQADDSFAGLAKYIGKEDLAQYYNQVYKEFGDLLETKDLQKINDYMVQAYPQFKQKLGCPDSDNVVSACGQ